MCFCNPTKYVHPLYRSDLESCTNNGEFKPQMIRALGTAIIKCAEFTSADVQPIITDRGYTYAISVYGSDDVFLVQDDDYPDLEIPEWCDSEYLPMGFKKAVALSEILHMENVKKFDIGENKEKYAPKLSPYFAYLKSIGEYTLFFRLKIWCIEILYSLFKVFLWMFAVALIGEFIAFYVGAPIVPYMISGALIGLYLYFIYK